MLGRSLAAEGMPMTSISGAVILLAGAVLISAAVLAEAVTRRAVTS